jgi:hypothetical protein
MAPRWRVFFLVPILLLLFACDAGEGMDLRLFCQRFSQAAKTQARLSPEQFYARGSCKFEACLGETMLLTLDAQPNGRIHTVALTALPEDSASAFRRTAALLLQSYCGLALDAAERRLNEISAGAAQVLGFQTQESGGFRLSYAANEAGRYLRVSQVRYLPQEPPLPTLKATVPTAAQDPLPPALEDWTSAKNRQGD